MDDSKKTTNSPQTDDLQHEQEHTPQAEEQKNAAMNDNNQAAENGNDDQNEKDKNGFFSNIFSGKKGQEQNKQPKSDDDSGEPVDPMQELTAELAKTKEALLRSRADFDNYRKRIAREYQDVRNQAKITVINDFLPVYDYFQLAVDHAEQNADLNALKQGMQMILTEFKRAFDSLGAEEVNAVGQDFDARWHEAVAQENNDDTPEGKVMQQWKCGFRMGETLIRPATVVVSAGPASQDQKQE